MAQSNIIVRLSLKDQDVVRRGLEQVGADGEKALKRIEAAGRGQSAGFKVLGQASDELRGQLGSLGDRAGTVGVALRALGPAGLVAAAGVGAAVVGFAALIRHAGEVTRHLGDINDQAQRVGTSAENMQVLRQVFIGNASSVAELNTILEKLHDTMGEALGGNEKAIASFARAGVSLDDLRAAGGDATIILDKLSGNIKGVGDSAERTALATDLMGRSAGGSVPAINALNGEMDSLRREGLEKGTVASNETARALAELKDKSALLDEQFSQLGAQGAVDFQRAVVDVKQALYDLESWFLRTADANARFWQRLVDDARRARAMSRDIATTGDSMTDDLLSGVAKEPEAYGPPTPYGPFLPAQPTAAPPPATPRPTSRPGGGGKDAAREAERRAEQIRQMMEADAKLVAGFERQVALFGKDRELRVEETVERLSRIATPEQADYLGFLVDKLEELKEARKQAEEAERAHQKVMDEGKRIFEQTRTPAEEYAATLGRLSDLLQQGAIDADTYSRATQQAADAFTSGLDKPKDEVDVLKDHFQGFGQVATSAFEDAIVKGEELSTVLEGLAEDIQRLLIRNTLNKLFDYAIDQGTGALAGLFGGGQTGAGGYQMGGFQSQPIVAGHGAAFDAGNVIPFARGGLVDRPTLFPMARGAGLMGEAGPEAILPLRRTPSGDLGVAAGAGSGNVTVNVINNAGAKVATEERKDENGNMTMDVMIDAVEQAMAQRMTRPGSTLNRAYRGAADPIRAR